MEPIGPVVIGILVIAGLAAVSIPILIAAFIRQRITWRVISNRSYRWMAVDGVNISEDDLRLALDRSLIALSNHRCFKDDTIRRAAREVHVVVQRVSSWESSIHNARVAGIAVGFQIYVGKDLAAVCHEFAHVCELIEDGVYDFEHAKWGTRRLYDAINEFENGLTR